MSGEIYGEVLDRLGPRSGSDLGSRVLSIEYLGGQRFRVWEECDHYFYEDLSTDDLRKLGMELVAAADSVTEGLPGEAKALEK